MNKTNYLKNPCRYSSLPFWKMKSFKHENIDIYHSEDYVEGKYNIVERYFRLIHHLDNINSSNIDVSDVKENDYDKLIEMINICYEKQNIAIDKETLLEYINRKVYHRSLWISIYHENVMIASGIAEYDEETKEGILEWVQVLPNYTRKGYGSVIVNSLLNRLKNLGAKFVTVSGNLDNINSPIILYRKCGFIGNDAWNICRK